MASAGFQGEVALPHKEWDCAQNAGEAETVVLGNMPVDGGRNADQGPRKWDEHDMPRNGL